MSRIPLQYLPAFQAAAELENLRSAAALLHLTPSAVSQQIGKLEEQLGFSVFVRQGRRVVLNEAGQTLLDSVRAALAEIDRGRQAAAAVANAEAELVVRMSVVPSLAQRWLMPRIGRWRSRHPGIRLQIDASRRVADLAREGLHVGLRTGGGPWPGLVSEPLFDLDAPLVALGCPDAARRLAGKPPPALAGEPLLGDPVLWERWFAAGGMDAGVKPAATFADTGLMLQAAEQDIGLALARGLYVVDALQQGRLVRLSDIAVSSGAAQKFFLAYPAALRDWPPLAALRAWLAEEIRQSETVLAALAGAVDGPAAPARA